MREILFRGYSVNGKEWIYGSLCLIENPLQDKKTDYYIIPRQMMWITNSDGCKMGSVYDCFEVIPDTIGQYTGLNYGIDNRKIFEGDMFRGWYFPDYKDYIVEYEKGGFFLGDDLLIDVTWNDYQYIGTNN